MLDQHRIDVQHTLDDLFGKKIIPFKLVAHKITQESPGEFTIYFYDSRLRSVVIGVLEGQTFGSQVRPIVLQRLAGVLQRLAGKKQSPTIGNVRTALQHQFLVC